jgi:hypothetical protein
MSIVEHATKKKLQVTNEPSSDNNAKTSKIEKQFHSFFSLIILKAHTCPT